ncbi:MAG: ankyrin repeat domain-containing protein [bacterium]|nr:ankyrin repeat domain-containing protein [bacterium]
MTLTAARKKIKSLSKLKDHDKIFAILREVRSAQPEALKSYELVQWAAQRELWALVVYLAKLGAPVEPEKDPGGAKTPFHEALFEGDRPDVARTLLRHGADANRRGPWGQVPIIDAATCGQLELMREMVARGADIHSHSAKYTPLSALCAYGMQPHSVHYDPEHKRLLKLIRAIVKMGADPDYSAEGIEPTAIQALHDADGRAVELLLNQTGANPCVRSYNGNTLLMHSTLYNDKEFFASLLRAGCEINGANRIGMTALHYAALVGNTPIMRFLLKHGADPATRDRRGATPGDYGTLFEHELPAPMRKAAGDEAHLTLVRENIGEEFEEFVREHLHKYNVDLKLDELDDRFLNLSVRFPAVLFEMQQLPDAPAFTYGWHRYLRLLPRTVAWNYACTQFEVLVGNGDGLGFFYDKAELLDLVIEAYRELELPSFLKIARAARRIYKKNDLAGRMVPVRKKMRRHEAKGESISSQYAVGVFLDREGGHEDHPEHEALHALSMTPELDGTKRSKSMKKRTTALRKYCRQLLKARPVQKKTPRA